MRNKDKFEKDTRAVIRAIIAKVADPFNAYGSEEDVEKADSDAVVYGMIVGQCGLLCAMGENAARMAEAGLISAETAANCEDLTDIMSKMILTDLESVHRKPAAAGKDDSNVVVFPTPKGVH